MRHFRTLFCLTALALAAVTPARTQTTLPAAEAQAIIAVINHSADDWNRGDLDAFATSYKNSPDILFMGRTIQHGYAQMLAHYKAAYTNSVAMGTLSFTQLDVQPLDTHFATVTGHFHLERTAAGGGNADGYFLLVVEHTPTGWKIVRDDTTVPPPPALK
jgi:ketosteroid isomerase-like protein